MGAIHAAAFSVLRWIPWWTRLCTLLAVSFLALDDVSAQTGPPEPSAPGGSIPFDRLEFVLQNKQIDIVDKESRASLSQLIVPQGIRAILPYASSPTGAVLYVALGTRGVDVFDLTDPRSPRSTVGFASDWTVQEMEQAGSALLLRTNRQGQTILYDVKNPFRPALLRVAELPSELTDPTGPSGATRAGPRTGASSGKGTGLIITGSIFLGIGVLLLMPGALIAAEPDKPSYPGLSPYLLLGAACIPAAIGVSLLIPGLVKYGQ